ncbi:MAG: ATP-dependent helicase [Bifidobacterium crudilactis]|jgi:superfamily I DNA/RNA helicase|nr:ATP-dependent helicase [Bifidobacterium crudilactis]
MILPEDWRPPEGITLEPNALRAVREPTTNVVVTAGPGAGKTELLAQRADFLLATGACRYPQRILAISFKVDAAQNIRERVRKRCGEQLAARFDSFTFHAFAKQIIDSYRVLLTGNDALDPDYTVDQSDQVPHRQITFNNLVPLAIDILQKSSSVRNAIRQTYSHVFLDEFQDTTSNQYSLLKEVFIDSDVVLTAVGDVKQRIMSWAGALDGIMQTFSSDFAAQRLTLYQNYRSEPVLRRMQNRMVQVMDPPAAIPVAEIAGPEGSANVMSFATSADEAVGIADQIKAWLNSGVPANEIAILVRQQPYLVCELLIGELNDRGIASRNEQLRQDLTAEPAVIVILNLIRVVADDRQPAAYAQLMRLVTRTGRTEEMALRSARAVSRFLKAERETFREGTASRSDSNAWKNVIVGFLRLLTKPVMCALSPEYQHGKRLNQLIKQAFDVFRQELDKDGDPIAALTRLSKDEAVRILTIHKSKGLEFEKVVVIGVESEFFWAEIDDCRAEFFVAISRAKNELILTHAQRRTRPKNARGKWEEQRHPMQEFLSYAAE